MDEMTNKQLQQLCRDAGLPDYGTKAVMIERLQKAAAAELVEDATDVVVENEDATVEVVEPVEAVKPEPVKVAAPAIIITPTVALENLPPANHAKHVEETLDAVRSRYQGIIVRYDSNEETFVFEGGRQGKTTTTARQPKWAVMSVAESYYNVARGRNREALGDIV
jgi:hypothetical protein